MAFIEWSEEFSVGNPVLDEQHRNLIAIVNRFEEARRRGKGTRVMNTVLNEIVGYTQEHFDCEERMMLEAGYPGLERHQSRHRQLLQKIERLQYEFQSGKRRVTSEVGELFRYWVTSHILKDDQDYSSCLGSRTADV